jgi:hypothetical protein
MDISLAFTCHAIFDELFSHITFYTSLSGIMKEITGLWHWYRKARRLQRELG